MRTRTTSVFQKLLKPAPRANSVGAPGGRALPTRAGIQEAVGLDRRASRFLYPSGERGVALILTLAIITLVTLLLIAFAVSMRVENAASKNFNDLIKARELAQGAIDQAVAQIRQGTPIRVGNATAGVYTNYVTFPGGAYYYDGTTPTFKPLYSCPSCPGTPLAANMTNLNASFWITGQQQGVPGGEFTVEADSAINVEWTYIAEDGTVGSAPLSKPLVGRFAFWVDDEASKININTAYQRPAALPVPLPSSTNIEVDLNMLLPDLKAFVPQIQFRQSNPGFTTIEEVKLAGAPAGPFPSGSDFNTNRFYLTTYSNDANYPSYTDDLDVFDRQRRPLSGASAVSAATDITDTSLNGAYGRLSDSALAKVYSSSGSDATFDGKYGVNGLKQLIANIIAYQIDPTTQWPPTDASVPPSQLPPPNYLGLAKTPYINEVQVHYVIGGTPVTIQRTVSVELFYTYDNTYTPGTEKIVVSGLSTVSGLSDTATITPPGGVYTGPEYRRCDGPLDQKAFTSGNGSASLTVTYMRDYSGNLHLLDYATTGPLSPLPLASSGIFDQDTEVNDPAYNEATGQWTPHKDAGTLPSQNRAGVYNPPETPPSKVVMRGDKMKSIGELGYIHRPDAPWKYLSLQPQSTTDKPFPAIPDWAMLDLFTVGGGTAGRININSGVIPGFPNTKRLVPLKALLNNVGTLPVATVAPQIYDDNSTTARADSYGMSEASGSVTLGIFDTIGELCEIPSLATGANEAAREAAIRRIANLITVRSSTFTIWVMAQSIKQPPNATIGTFTPGTDLITGEVRAQAVVERYENPPGTVKFRTRYFRYL
jgi:hypothetical protein